MTPQPRRRTRRSGPRGGLDLGGTKIQAVVVDERNQVLGQARHPTPTSGGPEGVAAELADALADAAAAAGIEPGRLAGVGVGSPGVVDERAGTVAQARNLPDWIEEFPLAARLGDAVGAPVWVGNDVSVATNAEFELGAGAPYDSLLGVFWGTGVGGGLVLGGRQWSGRGAAGEIGHVVVKMNGRHCPCGREGCMEAYAGRGSMEARARKLHKKGRKTDLFKIMEQRGRERLTSGIWARALEAGDKLATEIVDEAVEALGNGVASALNVLDVEAVVIGGGLGIRLGEPYAKRITDAMMPHLFTSERPPEVFVAALGDLGGAIGAALLVHRAND
ncbi:MAG: glucokinase [Thermoleophilaceae bacterium]|nr:glucokinase [Thermoleophilaceae bacterium]